MLKGIGWFIDSKRSIEDQKQRVLSLISEVKAKQNTIRADKTRTDVWKAAQLEEVNATFDRNMAEALSRVDIIRREVEVQRMILLDPVASLAGHKALSPGIETDLSVKAEFRELMRGLSTGERSAWFHALAEARDWGRLSVLAAMDPELRDAAKSLDIPDRDTRLKEAEELRRDAKAVAAIETRFRGIERWNELSAKGEDGTLSQSEQIELIKLGAAMTEEAPRPLPLTNEERQRHSELMRQPDLTPLEKAEVLTLAARIDQP